MAHEEFPPLTPEVEALMKAGYSAAFPDQRLPSDPWTQFNRRGTAAMIREAVRQAQEAVSPTYTGNLRSPPSRLVSVKDLLSIADNLHALPPPPPTREDMKEALHSLLLQINYHPNSQVAQEAQILSDGIAHYCKVQP